MSIQTFALGLIKASVCLHPIWCDSPLCYLQNQLQSPACLLDLHNRNINADIFSMAASKFW